MTVRSGDIGVFDATDELSGLVKIVDPVSITESEQLVPVAKIILASSDGIGLQRLEVRGGQLVLIVTANMRERAHERIRELQLPQCLVE